MNKRLAKLLTFYIVPKRLRHRVRGYLCSDKFSDLISCPRQVMRILRSKKARADYCLIEMNPFHIECLYSVYAYMSRQNKKCVVFTTQKNLKLNLFPSNIATFCISPYTIRVLDRLNFFNTASCVFVGSYFIWNYQKTAEFFLVNYIQTQKPLLTIDHAPDMHQPLKSAYKNVHQFVLADFMSKIYNMPVIWPIVFPCDNSNMTKDKNKFVSVGVIGDSNRRDMDTYLNWLGTTKSVKSDIISATIYDEYRPRLSKLTNVCVYERAPFDQLFRSCQTATFIPFLIHGQTLGYYDKAISGNLNLALAFALIPIIDTRLAKLYGFSDDNAILYDGQSDCVRALNAATKMRDVEIQQKQNNLRRLCARHIKSSIAEISKYLD